MPTPQLKRDMASVLRETQFRSLKIDQRKAIDASKRTAEVVFSSETPVRRWFGNEILGHRSDEVDLSRFEGGATVLVGHDHRDHVGVIERAWIDGTKGRAIIRFGNSARAKEVFQDVQDGILRHVSIGYSIDEIEVVSQSDDEPDAYRVTSWQPFEISLVTVPADVSAGVGRSKDLIMENKNLSRSEKRSQNAAVNAERERVAELVKTGEVFNAMDLAQRCIEDGKTVEALNKMILERNSDFQPINIEDPSIGLTEREIEKFSFARLILAQSEPDKYSRQAGFELDVCREAARSSSRDVRGLLIPHEILTHKRAHTVGSATAGGNLVATDLLGESFIDKLEKAMVVNRAGATMIPGLVGNVAIPRQTGGATHFWVAEDGSPSESSATFDQVTMTPKTVGAYTEISRRTLLQSIISIESFVQNELARRIALAIDLAGINGTGASNQPTGILSTAGVSVGAGATNGAAPDRAAILELESLVSDDDALVGQRSYVTNSVAANTLKQVLVDSGSGRFLLEGRLTNDFESQGLQMNGYQTLVSNQIPKDLTKGTGTNLSAIIFGNWSDLLIGMWGGLDILVNPYSLDTKGAVRVTAFQDVDINVRHPQSFAILNDVITS